jgi:hypothetical protein
MPLVSDTCTQLVCWLLPSSRPPPPGALLSLAAVTVGPGFIYPSLSVYDDNLCTMCPPHVPPVSPLPPPPPRMRCCAWQQPQ